MTEALRFAIGDTAFMATWDAREDFVVCPDCGGTGRLRVTFHDESVVSIACQNCSAGYDPPTGRVRVYDRKPRAARVRVNGMEVSPEGIRWRLGDSTNCYQICDDDKLFMVEVECMARAMAMCESADKEERDKVFKKEKDTRTWAWNASYHRREIKEAERRIAYHTSKLNVAAIKAKEDRAA